MIPLSVQTSNSAHPLPPLWVRTQGKMMSERDQSDAPGRGKKHRDDESKPRDDAERQPESGYADGHLDTRPSTDQRDEERRIAELDQTGSESEFDSEKPRA